MNTPQNRTPGGAAEPGGDDPSIPVLTERLGLPPLDFDTTLPLIETTGQMLAPVLDGLTALPGAPPAPPGASPAPAAPAASALADRAPLEFHVAPAVPAAQAATASPLAAAAAAPAAAPAPAPRPAPATVAPTPPGRPGFDGGHWARIEVELRSSILRAVAEHLPQSIESIVREQLRVPMEQVVARLAAETHAAITSTLRQSVEHAVRTELERLRDASRGSS